MWREGIFVEKLSTNGTEGIIKISVACKLRLAQLIRFVAVESIHTQVQIPALTYVLYLRLIILSMIDDIPIDNDVMVTS
jgi:hypothetical protein